MIRIILMPPIFAVAAVLQLAFYKKYFYMELFTAWFETIAVVSYFKLVNREFIPKRVIEGRDWREDKDLTRLDMKAQCRSWEIPSHNWVFPCCFKVMRPKDGARQYSYVALFI